MQYEFEINKQLQEGQLAVVKEKISSKKIVKTKELKYKHHNKVSL